MPGPADSPTEGTAIKPDASADLLLSRSPAPRHRQGAPAPDAGRFSPLNASQRGLLEAFLDEARPWAMRQARRAYRHLPAELHGQALDQAAVALRTGAASKLDRRSLYDDLARLLDDELRRIHAGWCLNQSRAVPDPPPVDVTPGTQPSVTAFIDDGLGGLERAVLQLELGAGRDTSTVRAALRLGPRQYARHRELGLGKLRGAITGGMRGRVCDQHLDAVTLAATGDRAAAERLASGPERCRACAREASGLRRVLQQRLALAPWPLAIKPAGILAAKIGGLGAVLGGKSAAGGVGGIGLGGAASGAKLLAAVVATAALASGGIAAVEPDRSGSAAPVVRAVSPAGPAVAAASAGTTTSATGDRRSRASGRAAKRRRKAGDGAGGRRQASTAGIAQEQQHQQPVQPAETQGPAGTEPTPGDAVRKTVDGVKKTVDRVTQKLPVPLPQVDEVGPAVDDVGAAVDGVLSP